MMKIYTLEEAQKSILLPARKRDTTGSNLSASILARTETLFGKGTTPEDAVKKIIHSVRMGGDAALHEWSILLDNQAPQTFLIPQIMLEEAYNALPAELSSALNRAAERIRQFHEFQPLPNWETSVMGGRLGQRARPVDRVGVYVPGGTAPLPSSLLMSVIPAQVAGVPEIIVCTPPNPSPVILAAAHLCAVSSVFQVGGAQAIAAMTFGTETIPQVDKIVGAGNLFVTLAKQQVFGLVGLDGLAGPTETMVIADHTASPAWIAADLLAQAEHDVLASAILLTPDKELADAVQAEIAQRIEFLSRADIIAQSLDKRSGIVVTPDLSSAARLASDYAPEHLCLSVENPLVLSEQIDHAGGLFLGEGSFEVLGDYIAGPSHVMPTGGTARFASPLNVYDFIKITSIIALDTETSQELSALAQVIAEAESLTAHAAAAQERVPDRKTL